MEVNVETDMKEKGWEAVDYISVAQSKNRCQTVLNTVINLRVPQNFDYARNYQRLQLLYVPLTKVKQYQPVLLVNQ